MPPSAGAKSCDVDVKSRNVLLGEEPAEEEEEDNFFLGDEALAPSTRRPAVQPTKPSPIKEKENKTNGDEEEEEAKSEELYLDPLGNTKWAFIFHVGNYKIQQKAQHRSRFIEQATAT